MAGAELPRLLRHKNALLSLILRIRLHLFFFCTLIPVCTVISADSLRCKWRSIIFLIMLCGAQYILRSDINDRDIELYDHDISKIRKCPQISEFQSRDIAKDSECRYKQCDHTDHVDKCFVLTDTVCCDF